MCSYASQLNRRWLGHGWVVLSIGSMWMWLFVRVIILVLVKLMPDSEIYIWYRIQEPYSSWLCPFLPYNAVVRRHLLYRFNQPDKLWLTRPFQQQHLVGGCWGTKNHRLALRVTEIMKQEIQWTNNNNRLTGSYSVFWYKRTIICHHIWHRIILTKFVICINTLNI